MTSWLRRVFLLSILWNTLAWSGELPPPVLSALKEAGVPAEAVSVSVQEIGSRQPLIHWNAHKAMNPASVMKLLTTEAALEVLGPAYTWKTEAWTAGRLEDGVLTGDLYIRGGGDPALTIERFELFLRELKARGIREVRGDLVLDRSWHQSQGGDPGSFDGDPLAPYNTLPDALILNFQALRLTLVPTSKAVSILPVPHLAGLQLINTIRPVSGPCGEWDEGLKAEWQPVTATLSVSGNYPSSCGERTWNLSPGNASDYFYRAFLSLWQELGGILSGPVREGQVPQDARLLATTISAPLSQAIRDINKFSNNLMARQLFLTLGAESPGPRRPATAADGDAAVRRWLSEAKLSMPGLVLENGSGLSRKERISADSLNNLLLHAWRRPTMPEFVSSLPIVAVDGTMRRRLANSGVAGSAHIKSGSLMDVKSIGGYVTARDGRRYTVVFIANHPRAGLTRPAQDALLQWVWAGVR